MNEKLVEAIVECVMFLETSDEDIVDPDAACEVLERVSALLGTIEGQERSEVVSTLEAIAARQKAPRRRESVTALVDYLRAPES